MTKVAESDIAAARREQGWTDRRKDVTKALWLDGKSASQIAKAIGGCTRNAVIGIIHRAGLSGRATPSAPVRRGPARRPTAPLAVAGNNTVFEKPPGRPPLVKPVVRAEAPGAATCLTLGAHMCKWPIGDPAQDGFTFCGRRQGDRRRTAANTPRSPTSTSRPASRSANCRGPRSVAAAGSTR